MNFCPNISTSNYNFVKSKNRHVESNLISLSRRRRSKRTKRLFSTNAKRQKHKKTKKKLLNFVFFHLEPISGLYKNGPKVIGMTHSKHTHHFDYLTPHQIKLFSYSEMDTNEKQYCPNPSYIDCRK